MLVQEKCPLRGPVTPEERVEHFSLQVKDVEEIIGGAMEVVEDLPTQIQIQRGVVDVHDGMWKVRRPHAMEKGFVKVVDGLSARRKERLGKVGDTTGVGT